MVVLNPHSDWPDSTIAFFDDGGKVWCKEHKPKAGEYEGELMPVLKRDSWASGVGICAHDGCGRLIKDLME